MKLLKINEEDRKTLLKRYIRQINEQIKDYDIDSSRFTVEVDTSIPVEEKLKIIYTPSAYLKCQELVRHFPGEVGWYGLVRQEGNVFTVYDVLIKEQKVNGARVIDDSADNEWFESLTDDQLDHLFLHAHSHVSMGTTPSSTDRDNQMNIVRNMGGEGFIIFQIWNKQGDINTFVYDLDKNMYYDRNDIEIEVSDETYGSLKAFTDKADELVKKIEPKKYDTPKSYSAPKTMTGYQYDPEKWFSKQSNLEKKLTEARSPSGFYWNDGMGHEGWD